MEIATPHGTARAHVDAVDGARGALILGHGAGGGVDAPDLRAARAAALEAGFSVARVEQPYRVAGRRSPAPAHQLDAAWIAAVEALPFAGLPLVAGGRSSGARVACRTAEATGAAAVLCLAFPLVSPRGASRLDELEAVPVPVLVVQGTTDRFGTPPPAPNRTVAEVAGDHGLKKDLPAVRAAVAAFLERVAGGQSAASSAAKRSPSTRQS
ncbi:MAG TPA: alpha/beta family hydrolase [Solirubrobacteraceae bacterium]|nr:alpha/beta family hydrolase [Solirubrobacteraceae bacterium]